MERRKTKYWLIFIATFLFLTFNLCAVHAVDELFLTGVVKKVDSIRGLVTVEVQSESCPGIMNFRVENGMDLEGSEGRRISFFINASTCSPHEIYPMHDIAFLKGHKP